MIAKNINTGIYPGDIMKTNTALTVSTVFRFNR